MPRELLILGRPPRPWGELSDAEKREWAEQFAAAVRSQLEARDQEPPPND